MLTNEQVAVLATALRFNHRHLCDYSGETRKEVLKVEVSYLEDTYKFLESKTKGE